MDKSPDAFRTISEVAEDLNVPQHVLRFWESKFNQIRPMKRGGGRRYYRPNDVELLRGIRHLLYGEGYTIRGVQKLLKERGVAAVAEIGRMSAGQGASLSLLPSGADDTEGREPVLAADDSAAHDADDEGPLQSARADARLTASRAEPFLESSAQMPLSFEGTRVEDASGRNALLREVLAELAEAHCILTGEA
jgi:DNA-binding transcriptional MerR regulator